MGVNVPFSPLVAEILTASAAMSADTAKRLTDSLMEQVAELHAQEDAIRCGVMELLDGPYMPTPAAIERALYPSAEFVARFRRDLGGAS